MSYPSFVIIGTGTRHTSNHELALNGLKRAARLVWGPALYAAAPLLIVGDATGMDVSMKVQAEKMGWDVQRFEADWTKLGNAAGPMRNSAMIARAVQLRRLHLIQVVCVAFPDEFSKGTWDCAKQAAKVGIEVLVIPMP